MNNNLDIVTNPTPHLIKEQHEIMQNLQLQKQVSLNLSTEYMKLREKTLENDSLKREIINLQQKIKELQTKFQIAIQYRDVAVLLKQEIESLKQQMLSSG